MTLIMAPLHHPVPEHHRQTGRRDGPVASDLVFDPLLVVRQSTAPPPSGVGRPTLSRLDMGARAVDPEDHWRAGSCRNVAAKDRANTGHGLWLPLAR
jgi:hypothetical protein